MNLVPVWVALGVVVALLVGIGASLLAHARGDAVASAVLVGGAAFAGTLTLSVMVISLLAREK